jgi:hypothetical protein
MTREYSEKYQALTSGSSSGSLRKNINEIQFKWARGGVPEKSFQHDFMLSMGLYTNSDMPTRPSRVLVVGESHENDENWQGRLGRRLRVNMWPTGKTRMT